MRREYLIQLTVNGRTLKRLLIDSHYEAKHSKTMNDALIIDLVRTLDGRTYGAESVTPDGWEI